jgi:hypothetical protein
MDALSSGLDIRPPAPFEDLQRYIRDMRILILTHPRSGGFSLLSWISRELNYTSYHEPLQTGFMERSQTEPNCVVKEDVSSVLHCFSDLSTYMNRFDLVIFHTRETLRDCAISRVRQLETGESHKFYKIDALWLADHEAEISRTEMVFRGIQGAILSAAARHKGVGITTSYEGVYDTGVDIKRICQLIEVRDPQWTDMLHPKRRLQGGDPDQLPAERKARII